MIWKALVVEIIRSLWDEGLYRQNPTLKRIHDEWFSFWVEWKTEVTMQDVDRQIEELVEPAEVDAPVFWEEEGNTPLGGKMGLRAPWHEDDN